MQWILLNLLLCSSITTWADGIVLTDDTLLAELDTGDVIEVVDAPGFPRLTLNFPTEANLNQYPGYWPKLFPEQTYFSSKRDNGEGNADCNVSINVLPADRKLIYAPTVGTSWTLQTKPTANDFRVSLEFNQITQQPFNENVYISEEQPVSGISCNYPREITIGNFRKSLHWRVWVARYN